MRQRPLASCGLLWSIADGQGSASGTHSYAHAAHLMFRQAVAQLSRAHAHTAQLSSPGLGLHLAHQLTRRQPVSQTLGQQLCRTASSSAGAEPVRELPLTLLTGPHWASLRSLAQAYKQLSKLGLSALVVSTAAAGFVAGAL